MVCRDSPLSSVLRVSFGVHTGTRGMGLNWCWLRPDPLVVLCGNCRGCLPIAILQCVETSPFSFLKNSLSVGFVGQHQAHCSAALRVGSAHAEPSPLFFTPLYLVLSWLSSITY